MSEHKECREGRAGLRGWRALIVVVGSGTLAAFMVVGLIAGAIKGVSASFSGTPDPQKLETSRSPRESIAPNKLNLCQLVEAQSLMMASPHNRVDDGEGYLDTAAESPGRDTRTVSDECTWKVAVAPPGMWMFDLSYTAFMSTSGDESKKKLSQEDFEERKESARGEFSSIGSSGGVGPLSGDSWYCYGVSGDGERSYVLVRMNKTGVYQISLAGLGGSLDSQKISERDFRSEAVKVATYLDQAFEHQIPD